MHTLPPAGTPLGDSSLHATQLAYSLDMHGLSLVLSDGRGVFLTSRSSRLEPQEVAAVSIPGLTGATCSALNGRYRLVAFGKEEWVKHAIIILKVVWYLVEVAIKGNLLQVLEYFACEQLLRMSQISRNLTLCDLTIAFWCVVTSTNLGFASCIFCKWSMRAKFNGRKTF